MSNTKCIKELKIKKCPLKVGNPNTSEVDKYKIWAIPFCKNIIGAQNKDSRMSVK